MPDPYQNVPRSSDLGKLVKFFASLLDSSSSWDEFVRQARPRTSLDSCVRDLPHPAAELLEKLRVEGAPFVRNDKNWTQDKRDAVAHSTGYPSTLNCLGFTEQEMVDMAQKGYFAMLPCSSVRHLEDLRLSHAGAIPQNDRRPRTIIDCLRSGANDSTVPLAPRESMQFGRAADRLFHSILTADPSHGPIFTMKHDIADGFYRTFTQPTAALALAMVMPVLPGEEPLIAMPLALPMGWTESPPLFCSLTETVVDLANTHVTGQHNTPVHPLEHLASSEQEEPDDGRIVHTELNAPRPPPQAPTASDPLLHFDVFVDDSIGLAQGEQAHLQAVRREFLHVNDTVFRRNAPDEPQRREPTSTKKLKAGDALWSTHKTMLGWVVDALRGTIELPARKRDRLLAILDAARNQRRISVRKCQKLLGELRSMLLAVAGGSGLFSQLQHALKTAKGKRVRLTRQARDHLHDLHALACDVAARPTHLRELFPTLPGHYLGATDAAKPGMGGIVYGPTGEPHLWRTELPPDVKEAMLTDDNPDGIHTNSDFELAATVLHEAILGSHFDLKHRTVRTGSDNIPAVAWRNKGSASTKGSAAYLLRLASLQQRRLSHIPRVHCIPGMANILADIASRRFDLSSSQLLALFDSIAPQNAPWRELQVPPAQLSTVISAIRQQRQQGTSPPTAHAPPTKSGTNAGYPSFESSAWQTIPFSPASTTKSHSFGSLLTGLGTVEAAEAVTQSELSTWLTKSITLSKRSRNWGPRTPVWMRSANKMRDAATY